MSVLQEFLLPFSTVKENELFNPNHIYGSKDSNYTNNIPDYYLIDMREGSGVSSTSSLTSDQ